jgi:hypothetical protein|tara:strand:- start:333 stop:1292 length:960 start_codon:yes stop_codon:yes gene_type:complete
MGIKDSYDNEGDDALGETVEYFHPQITLDDRMRYIMENIVLSDMSMDNIICNTIISHFYGGRGIHQILTRDPNPKTALVNFERLLVDKEYEMTIRKNIDDALSIGLGVYGTTELRTSLYGASNSFVAESRDLPRNADKINILLWVASFIPRGITKRMAAVNSLQEMYNILTELEGVGQYYGYHCSTSNSVNPRINIDHDERFCVPGPGARLTLDMMFPPDCGIPHGDRVIWFRENYKDLIGDIYLHESTHNVIVGDTKIFQHDQNELKTYGCEVGLCQFGVYSRLSDNKSLINKRKVARADETLMEYFFNNNFEQTALF